MNVSLECVKVTGLNACAGEYKSVLIVVPSLCAAPFNPGLYQAAGPR